MIKLNKNTKIIVKKKPYKVSVAKKIKATKVVTKLVENGGNMGKAIIEAGYSPNTAKTPSKVTNSEAYKEASLTLLEKLEKIQKAQIEELLKRNNSLSMVQYTDMVKSLEKTTKLVELLSGRPTDRNDNILNSDQLHELLTRGSKEAVPTRKA